MPQIHPRARHDASPACHVAVCFYGMLTRFHVSGGLGIPRVSTASRDVELNQRLTRDVAYPSFVRRIVQPNPQCSFDTFVHTWEAKASGFIEQLYRPRAAAYGELEGVHISLPGSAGWPHSATPRMWASVEKLLALKSEAEAARGTRYDWVLITRFDVAWGADLTLQLNPNLFYVANWCYSDQRDGRLAALPAEHAASGRTCLPLADPDGRNGGVPFNDPGRVGVPDYYFLASSELIDRAFLNLTAELEAGVFRATYGGSSNHKVAGGRLKQLGLLKPGAEGRLGRQLYHQHDVAILRAGNDASGIDSRFDCLAGQRHGAQVEQPQGQRQRRPERRNRTRPVSYRFASPEQEARMLPKVIANAKRWQGDTFGPTLLSTSWRGADGQPYGRESLDELQRPALFSRCFANRSFCLCEPSSWSRSILIPPMHPGQQRPPLTPAMAARPPKGDPLLRSTLRASARALPGVRVGTATLVALACVFLFVFGAVSTAVVLLSVSTARQLSGAG